MSVVLDVVYALRSVWDVLGAHLVAGVPLSMLLVMKFMAGFIVRYLRRLFK